MNLILYLLLEVSYFPFPPSFPLSQFGKWEGQQTEASQLPKKVLEEKIKGWEGYLPHLRIKTRVDLEIVLVRTHSSSSCSSSLLRLPKGK
jgi:hypothetical protein